MEKKNLTFFLLLFTVILLSPTLVQADLCRWQGYANISGTLVNTTDYITIHNGTKTYNATIFTTGMYTADIQAASDATISFKICGVDAAQGGQVWSCPATDFNTLNLSITALSTGVACSYSCACGSGNYCCSGATEYTSGEGTGTCQSSACSAAAEEPTPSPGAVSPGGVVTVTEEGESKTFTVISAGGTGTFTITDNDTFKVIEITITVVDQVNNVKITIKTSSLPTGASLPISEDLGKVYKYLEITKGNITNANISLVKIKFKVAKAWLNNNNISSNSIALQRYSAGSWTKLTTEKVDEDSSYYYYVAETTALSIFAITGEFVVEKETCPYECCVGEADYIDKACSSGYECEDRVCVAIAPPKCPTCPSPTEWGECIEGKQSRTNYRCGAETNYECEGYTEEEDCVEIRWIVKYWPAIFLLIFVSILIVVVVSIRKLLKHKRHSTSMYPRL